MADPIWLVGVKLVAVFVFVLLNAFFVAAEFAIVKVRTTQLSTRIKEGDVRAAVAKRITTHLDAYLSACQLGITISSLGLGWIGEPAVANLIEPLFVAVGVSEPLLLHGAAFAIAFSFITVLHIVFGELAPKSISIRHPEQTALRLARPLDLFFRIFSPAIRALNSVSNRTLKVLGFEPATSTEQTHSFAELREILAEGMEAPAGRKRVLMNLFDLADLKVGDVMTPITRVVALDARKSLEENIRIADDAGYSRYPLVDGSLDSVLGMVHYKDIFSRVIRKDRPEQTLLDIKRDLPIVPDSQAAETLLTDFIQKGRHMALVVDEHGRTVGLATMEDVFEEVFGSIRDEFDEPEPVEHAYKVLADGHYLVDGTMNLHDLSDLLGVNLRKPGISTVSGWIIDYLGRMPLAGENFHAKALEITLREVGRRRVKSAEFKIATSAPAR